MEKLPVVGWLWRLFLRAGWAPLGVVILHLVLADFGLTQRFDHLLHFLGGASICFFLTVCLGLLISAPARRSSWLRYMLAFTSACTIALFWEFAEFGSDRFRGTSVQESLSETMLDLVFGVLGATMALLCQAACRWCFKPESSKPTPPADTSRT